MVEMYTRGIKPTLVYIVRVFVKYEIPETESPKPQVVV